jgi:multiple sugar transport system permease protein
VIFVPGRRRARSVEGSGPALIGPDEWRRARVKWGFGGAQVLLLVGLIVIGLGPLIWLAKSAITPTNDTITYPMALFPHGAAWSNLHEAWSSVQVGKYFWNTVVLAIGSWFAQVFVATTAGFALSVLRPAYARMITALLLTTLFVPAVVLLVPLYVEIVHPPLIHHSFIDSYWAVWLPAGASAFNVVLVARFFDNLPREIFEAARIDGAGPFRLFWSVVLPMSKPILGVVPCSRCSRPGRISSGRCSC